MGAAMLAQARPIECSRETGAEEDRAAIAGAGLGDDAGRREPRGLVSGRSRWGTWWLPDRVSGVRCHLHSKMPLFLGRAPRPESHSAFLISAPIILGASVGSVVAFSPEPNIHSFQTPRSPPPSPRPCPG